jgi:transposase-like protein
MESATKLKRKRYSAAERRELLAAWRSSGQSAKRFGQARDVHASNLIRWQAAESGATAKRSKRGFVELRATVESGRMYGDVSKAQFEIECPGGVRVRALRDVDIEVLARLVIALEGNRGC